MSSDAPSNLKLICRRKDVVVLVSLVLLVVAAFCPVQETLSHPERVKVQIEDGIEAPVSLGLVWYDYGLNTNTFSKEIEFSTNDGVTLPQARVPTQVWRLTWKRVATRFDKWSGCEHCDGPWVDCWLRLKEPGGVPSQSRLVQTKQKDGDRWIITASVLPNEAKFTPREFKPSDVQVLIAEAKALIDKQGSVNIKPVKWGPELQRINPVRVECRNSALILWMGGKVGYMIVPDSSGAAMINMAWITGTDFKHIYKVERM